jgi:hypothetical protein
VEFPLILPNPPFIKRRGFLRGWKTPPIVIDEVFVEDSRDIPVPKFEYVEDEPIIDRGNFSGFASF